VILRIGAKKVIDELINLREIINKKRGEIITILLFTNHLAVVYSRNRKVISHEGESVK